MAKSPDPFDPSNIPTRIDPNSPEARALEKRLREVSGFPTEDAPMTDFRTPEMVPPEELAETRRKALEFYEEEMKDYLHNPSPPTPPVPPIAPALPATPAVPTVPPITLAPSAPSPALGLAGAALSAVPQVPTVAKVVLPLAVGLATQLSSKPSTPSSSPSPTADPVPPVAEPIPDPAEPALRQPSRPKARVVPSAVLNTLASPTAEFEFESDAHSPGELAVLELEHSEELSSPFSAQVTLVAQEGVQIDPAILLGQEAVLTIHLDGDTRYIHGIVASVDEWDTGAGADRSRYVVEVVPALWRLRHRIGCRIFQELSVPEIVGQVLREGGIDHRLVLSNTYPKRDYCVQYRESDLDFISRLLEDEGIFYCFEHEHDHHTLVLRDAAIACPELSDDPQILFREESGMANEEHVFAFRARRALRPSVVTLRDFNFLNPTLDLTAAAGGSGSLEVYDFPGGYNAPNEGHGLSRTRLEELRVKSATAAGSSTSRRLHTGCVFEMTEHPEEHFNAKYLLLSVQHRVWQPEALGAPHFEGSPRGERRRYVNTFTCLRKGAPFRPERKTPRATIPGPQTAMVVGPPSEEIFTDEHGRIKVQFHWDRRGRKDDRSSCWIRVSQAWAGPGWGALYLPRIGHEVVVEFEEGDPDRPLITGSVYNGNHPPPISLPAEKTKSTIRSASSPGSHGSNELRFEDAAGSEEIYFHAQKDLAIVVENDKSQHVGRDETLRVDNDRSRSVGGNQSLLVEKDDTSTIGQNQSLEVGQNRTTAVGGNHTETISGSQSVSIGATSSTKVLLAAAETIGLGKALTVGGAYAVTVGAAMNELVGGLRAEEVMGERTEIVGAKKSERVVGSRTLQVGGNIVERVDGTRTLKVQQDLALDVAGSLQHAVKDTYRLDARKLTLNLGEKLLITAGAASLEISQNGDVTINGVKVDLSASGPLTLKGSGIVEN
jgi:type VI secretion system secreted protein VgrG